MSWPAIKLIPRDYTFARPTLDRSMCHRVLLSGKPGEEVSVRRQKERERERGKAERRERQRPVFVEMFSYLRENVQRSRRKGRGNDSWRMKRGRDHGGNLFIEPSRDLSGPG